ncbi:MAG: hypothetical protein RJA70_3789, partial [Pseudomonadota bacterium]
MSLSWTQYAVWLALTCLSVSCDRHLLQ